MPSSGGVAYGEGWLRDCVWSAGCTQLRIPHSLVERGGSKQMAAEMVGLGGALAAAQHQLLFLLLLCFLAGGARASPATDALSHASPRAAAGGLCQQLLLPQGYPCTEHTVRTSFPLHVLDFFVFLWCRELVLWWFAVRDRIVSIPTRIG